LIEDMKAYRREWYTKNCKNNPDYITRRRERRLANYEVVREQEKKSRAKNIEKHRTDSKERMKEYRHTERYKEVRRAQVKRKYGLTEATWDALFASQGRACAICKAEESATRRWHTDHCHGTGTVRGILCQHCNLMLGHAKDDPSRLAAAIEYLTKI
jgi:hypothetical protein